MKNFKNNVFHDQIAFFIRAYNEGQKIGEVLEEIIANGYKKIVIVNDWSTDNTQEKIEEIQQKYADCLLIDVVHAANRGDRGAGAATKTGLSFFSRYHKQLGITRIVFFDADGQMDINDMKNFSQVAQQDGETLDALLGSRFLKNSKVENMPAMRRVILHIAHFVNKLFYGSWVTDPHCGYRMFRASKLSAVHLRSDGMHYANELNEQMKLHKFRIRELPVHVLYTDYSLQKWQKNSNSILLAFEMVYRKFFHR